MKNQNGSLLILIMVAILITVIAGSAYYLVSQENTKPLLTQNPDTKPAEEVTSVKVEAGDLVVTKNNENKKITAWGYNSSPTLSPDKSKIAYISKSEETFENKKKLKSMVPESTNVWIINIDGSNPMKITIHKDWVYRDNLVWLDDNNLLYTDGTSSVKAYNSTDKSTKNVLGPEIPNGVCLDVCGGDSQFLLSPDKKYLVLLSSGSLEEGGVVLPYQNQILNLESLIPEKMNQAFSSINYDTAQFNQDSLFIYAKDVQTNIEATFNINLKTGEVSYQ